MSPLVKLSFLQKRKKAIRKYNEETVTRLQIQINGLIHSNQVNVIKNEKNVSRKWWEKVK